MEKHRRTGARAKTCIVELLGKAGSGKSAVIAALKARAPFYAGKPRGARKKWLLPYFVAFGFLVLFGMSVFVTPVSYPRMFRSMVRVERGVQWVASLQPGVYVIDEGPLRTLANLRWRSDKELLAWERYSIHVLRKLASLETELAVCKVNAAPETRFDRRRKRWAEDPRREKGAVTQAESYDEYRKAYPGVKAGGALGEKVLDELRRRLGEKAVVFDLDNSGDRDLNEVAAELVGKVELLRQQAEMGTTNPKYW